MEAAHELQIGIPNANDGPKQRLVEERMARMEPMTVKQAGNAVRPVV